jgi:hypothetical protein
MTAISEDRGYQMVRDNETIVIDVSHNPGYGLACGLIYGATLKEAGEVVRRASGTTVEIAISRLFEL